MKTPNTLQGWLKAALAIVAALIVTVTLSYNGGDHSVHITLNGAPIGPTAEAVYHEQLKNDEAASSLKGATPPTAVVEANERAAQRGTTGPNTTPLTQTLATPSQPGCKSKFNTNNFSSRNGARLGVATLHYTASPNIPGWADVLGNAAYLNNPRVMASANFINDSEGHCVYTVPTSLKAWTNGNGNLWSWSIEQINSGTERVFTARAGLRSLARILYTQNKAYGIPNRRGRVDSHCNILRTGIVEHNDWGACGGNHFDIKKANCTKTRSRCGYSVARVVAATRSYAHDVEVDGRRCRELKRLRQRAAWRRQHHHSPAWLKSRAHRATKLKNSLGSKAVNCR